jgi:hypothetical protein
MSPTAAADVDHPPWRGNPFGIYPGAQVLINDTRQKCGNGDE